MQHLRDEARNIRHIEQRFMQVLTDALDAPSALGHSMTCIDRQLLTQDISWRSILSSLDALGPERNDFRRAVLVRYVQYLRSHRFALREAYAKLKRREHVAIIPEPEPDSDNPSQSLSHREAAIFEIVDLAPREGGPH